MKMDLVVRMRFGSHLYGTETPNSDFDFKSIFVPEATDIIFGRVEDVVHLRRQKAFGEKTKAGETEEEAMSLKRYLDLLADGDPMAIDMLFAPDRALLKKSAAWFCIQSNRHRLVTRKSAAAVSYCRKQADKYGIRGSRVAAVRSALSLLTKHLNEGKLHRVEDIQDDFMSLSLVSPHIRQIRRNHPNGKTEYLIEVCGKKISFRLPIIEAWGVMKRLMDNYGHRSLLAEQNQGVDWKGMSHAVRYARQMVDLFKTGEIRFPLEYTDHLKSIKAGEISYDLVAKEVEDMIDVIQEAGEASTLPDEVDHEFIEKVIYLAYTNKIGKHMIDMCDWTLEE